MVEYKTNKTIDRTIENLFNWVIKHQYRGWDVYDGLNNPHFKNIKNFYLKILMIQGNIYSPINFRPFLGIQKGVDLKAMTLFSQAYALLYTTTGDKKYLGEMNNTIQFIKENSLKNDFGCDSWSSHYFPYIGTDKTTLSSNTPDIIGTSQAIIALGKSYNITKNSIEAEIASSATQFLVKKLLIENNNSPFFKYTGSDECPNHIVLNASAQAIDALSAFLNHEKNSQLQLICERVSHTLLNTQQQDGSWPYSIYSNGSIKRIQLDFHQGFIIDGLLAFLPYSDNPEKIKTCILKAANYYQNTLFRQNGTSYYRYPLPYPIDIHNQAQGIITFSKLSNLDIKWLDFAKIILIWTIQNMQDKKGFFYHHKWPFFTNKIPYMRWGQAWMLLAIAEFLKRNNSEKS